MKSALFLFFFVFIAATVFGQRQQRQFNNNNGNNFRSNNNNGNGNFNNANNPNYRHVEPVYSYGLDTSNGQYSKFNGPVKGLPAGHGGGKYGAADCLLCGR